MCTAQVITRRTPGDVTRACAQQLLPSLQRCMAFLCLCAGKPVHSSGPLGAGLHPHRFLLWLRTALQGRIQLLVHLQRHLFCLLHRALHRGIQCAAGGGARRGVGAIEVGPPLKPALKVCLLADVGCSGRLRIALQCSASRAISDGPSGRFLPSPCFHKLPAAFVDLRDTVDHGLAFRVRHCLPALGAVPPLPSSEVPRVERQLPVQAQRLGPALLVDQDLLLLRAAAKVHLHGCEAVV
mmetsp:Transcript_61609/g.198408  ORF Transcript_61609/g.198408 Transcript_61609/m.198408 type:complete len:239 (+) Transcript_61609:352-1068(+)